MARNYPIISFPFLLFLIITLTNLIAADHIDWTAIGIASDGRQSLKCSGDSLTMSFFSSTNPRPAASNCILSGGYSVQRQNNIITFQTDVTNCTAIEYAYLYATILNQSNMFDSSCEIELWNGQSETNNHHFCYLSQSALLSSTSPTSTWSIGCPSMPGDFSVGALIGTIVGIVIFVMVVIGIIIICCCCSMFCVAATAVGVGEAAGSSGGSGHQKNGNDDAEQGIQVTTYPTATTTTTTTTYAVPDQQYQQPSYGHAGNSHQQSYGQQPQPYMEQQQQSYPQQQQPYPQQQQPYPQQPQPYMEQQYQPQYSQPTPQPPYQQPVTATSPQKQLELDAPPEYVP